MHISITNMRNDKGKVLISIFNSAKGFPSSPTDAVAKAQLVIKNKTASLDIDLARGDYAIALMHDENNNGEMDKKALGLPKEGYGFSQNVMGTFGPPSFKKAAIDFPEQKSVEIRMKY